MERRQFFKTMIGGVAAAAAVRTWPFRVYSFPSVIALSRAPYPGALIENTVVEISSRTLRIPIVIRRGSIIFEPEGMIGRGTGSTWDVVTASSKEELREVIRRYGPSQSTAWAEAVGALEKQLPFEKDSRSLIPLRVGLT